VMFMALTKHDSSNRQLASRRFDIFDRFVDDWPEMLRRPVLFWPERSMHPMHVEEFTEDGTLVVRVELAGIDPDRDVEISVEGGKLHINAERREEEKVEERDYARREFYYGAFHRDLPLPKGTSGVDVKASYKDGILEVRVPMTKDEALEPGMKIPVTKG